MNPASTRLAILFIGGAALATAGFARVRQGVASPPVPPRGALAKPVRWTPTATAEGSDHDLVSLRGNLIHQWAEAFYRHNHGLLRNAPIGSPCVAVTFDDGPKPDGTPIILDLLRQHHAHATFFLVGKQCVLYPNLVARIAGEGHELGNHTYDHFRLPTLPLPLVAMELEKNRQLLRRITGETTYLFRPPGGRTTPSDQAVVDSLGYTTVFWRIDSGELDRSMNADRVYHRVVDQIQNGDIVLMHNGDPVGLAALPRILATLDHRGYRCVTVSELVQLSGGSPDLAPMSTGPENE